MFDIPVLVRAVVAAVAVMSGAVDAAVEAVRSIDLPATVSTPAERGDATQVGDTLPPSITEYVVPVVDVDRAGWGDTHAAYPATDIFLECGATLVSPVSGTVLEVRRVDAWDPATDDPATRGGRSVAVKGWDGVRYYLAHFDSIDPDLAVGDRVEAGDPLGTMGDTGRTSACHLHFSLSPPCPAPEWRVRRGVVWPSPYLDAWRAGEQRTPAAEVAEWLAEHPTACADAHAEFVEALDGTGG